MEKVLQDGLECWMSKHESTMLTNLDKMFEKIMKVRGDNDGSAGPPGSVVTLDDDESSEAIFKGCEVSRRVDKHDRRI